MVTDNAGMELVSDLALAHYLLSCGAPPRDRGDVSRDVMCGRCRAAGPAGGVTGVAGGEALRGGGDGATGNDSDAAAADAAP